MDERTVGWADRCTGGREDGRTGGLVDGQTGRRAERGGADGWTGGKLDGWTGERKFNLNAISQKKGTPAMSKLKQNSNMVEKAQQYAEISMS